MPILRFDDAPEFEVAGVRGLASPSREASETTMYRVELGPGQQLPRHTHDREEVFHVLEGSATAVLDGVEQRVAAGDTAMIAPGVEHYSAGPPSRSVEIPSRGYTPSRWLRWVRVTL